MMILKQSVKSAVSALVHAELLVFPITSK